MRRIALFCLLLGCSSVETGMECAQDGACPDGLTCFADWRCREANASPDCVPACYGDEPYCDRATLRCVACLGDQHCEGVGTICSPASKRCVHGCSASHMSCPEGTKCDVERGVCRGCNDDRECKDPAAPRCETEHGRCVACVPDRDDCPAGRHCVLGEEHASCEPGCKDASECAGKECCGGKCVALAADGENCGGCGNRCRAGKVCCAGACADLTSDVEHCGGCGVSCLIPSVVSPACVASKCSHKGCESYFGDCDGDPKNGCETNLTMDPKHCFMCKAACVPAPNTVPTCSVSGCVTGPCVAGFANCDGSTINGCEVNLASDPLHCGACGKACPTGTSCVSGKCG